MNLFSKNYIDSVAEKAVFHMPIVQLVRLTNEDIAQYKKDFKEEKCRSHVPKKSLPLPKKLKLHKKRKDVLKLVISKDDETDQYKSSFKSVETSQKHNTSSPPFTIISPVGSNMIENKKFTSDKSIESISFNSPIGSIKVCDFKTLMNDAMYKRYVMLFLQNNTNNLINDNLIHIITPDESLNVIITVPKDKLKLTEIENIYMKYFSTPLKNAIIIISSLLNIIIICNIHHKARMDESLKMRTEAEKLKEMVDATKMHMRHKKVLEMKFKKYFVDVITSFDDSELDHAFQMFFLSILTVLRVLNPPKFKKGHILKNLILLLKNSLKESGYKDPKIIRMLKDKNFYSACVDLINIIQNSRHKDPYITDRMEIFFLSEINDREYFQPVIDAVNGESNEDLGLLIDSAAYQCLLNSKLKNPINTLIEKNISSNNNEDQIHWVIEKSFDGNYQPIPVTSDCGRPPKTAKITFDPEMAGHNLTLFYKRFSSCLKEPPVSPKSVVSKAIAPKINAVTPITLANCSTAPNSSFAPTTLDNGSMTQSATHMLLKSSILNNKSFPTTSNHKTVGNTFSIDNKKVQLVRRPLKTASPKTNNIIFKTPQNRINPVVHNAKECIESKKNILKKKDYKRHMKKSRTLS